MADLIIKAAAIYGIIGFLFSIAFVAVGASRIDGAARGAPIGFRLLIVPGAAALWPWMASKWISAGR